MLSRMAGDRTVLLAAATTALFATTVLATLVGYTGSVTREGLRRTLAEATFESTGTTIGVHVPAHRVAEVRGQVGRALRRIYGDVPLTVSMSARSDTYTLPGQDGDEHPDLAAFGTWTDIEKHARLTAGHWPRATQGKPGAVPDEPGAAQNKPGPVQGKPGAVPDEPGAVQGKPGAVPDEPGAVQNKPGAAQKKPGAAPGEPRAKQGEVEAVLPASAARAIHARVGDVLTLRGRVDERAVARVRVVGLFEVPDPDGYFWQDDRLITSGVERLDYTTYGPFVVPPEVFAQRFTGSGVDARFSVLPDLRRLDVGGLLRLRDRMAAAPAALVQAGGGGTQFTVVTRLAELVRRLHDAVLVARSTMLVPVIQLLVLAGCAWLLVARLLTDHRRGEVALLRTRGLAMRQLARLGLAEALLVVLPAAVLGPLLAGPVLRLAGHAPAVRASGLRLDAGPLAVLGGVSAATALACAAALVVPALRGANRSYVEVRTAMGRPPRGGGLGSGLDLVLLAVAGIAIWQLTRYGAAGANAAGANATGANAAGIDPFIVAGPALALLAGGLLILRLLPAASRVAERAATRRRGLVSVLGTRQVGRRPLRYAGPVLLLAMAMAVGVLSVTTMATWRRSQNGQADFQSGADLRIVGSDAVEGPAPPGRAGRLAALPGVTAVTAVLRMHADVGESRASVLGVDAAALGPVLRVPDELRRGLRLGELARARPAVPALAVPGRPRRLRFDVRLRRTGPVPAALRGDASPSGTPFRFAVTLADARGLAHRVTLPALAADGAAHTLAVDLAVLAGTDGVLAYPLSIRGVDYAYDLNPVTGPVDLDLLRVRGDDGDAALPAGARWDAFGESSDSATVVPGAADAPGGLLRLSVPPPPHLIVRGRTYLASNGVHAHALVATGRPPAHAPGNAKLRPAVPGVVTSALAGRAKVAVGGVVTVTTADGDQPIRVAGIVPALPSVPAGEPGALVDLPTLTERRLAATGADPAVLTPGEWWASARTGTATRALAAHPGWGRVDADRAAARVRLRDAPLGTGLQGALVLGFGTGLAFAVIAFAVNAAVTAGERSREFGVLRILGVPPRQVAGMLAIEQAYLVALGVLGGTVLGLVVARLAVPPIVLGVRAARPYPPVAAVFPWPVLFAMIVGVTAVLGLVLLPVLRAVRRRDLAAGLRTGDER